jgi:hypothetical protein
MVLFTAIFQRQRAPMILGLEARSRLLLPLAVEADVGSTACCTAISLRQRAPMCQRRLWHIARLR